ncbi:MAG: type IV pilus assembly protein PilB [Gammaproteobacteria bacterium]|jgi:type IV pilus assembly protein PilB
MSVTASNMAESASSSKTKPLGVRLIDASYLSEAQLNLALREKDRAGGYLGEVLVSLGSIGEDVLTESLAVETQTQVVDVLSAVIHEDVLQRVPYAVAKRHRLLPLAEEGGVLTVAMADPFDIVVSDLRRWNVILRCFPSDHEYRQSG